MNRRIALSITFIAFNLMACCCGGVGPAKGPKQAAVTQAASPATQAITADLTDKGHEQSATATTELPKKKTIQPVAADPNAGRIYVKGYTTKSGRVVPGYYRNPK